MSRLRILCWLFVVAWPQAKAGSVYLGYSQTDHLSFAGFRELNFTPSGPAVLLTFEPSDKLSLAFNFAELTDHVQLTNQVGGQLGLQSYAASASYYAGAWSFSASYAHWQDDLSITADSFSPRLLKQHSDSPSLALSLAYDWQLTHWQLGMVAGLHYSDWEFAQTAFNLQSQQVQSAVDKGNSNFVSLTFLAARAFTLIANQDVILGGSISWNQLGNSDASAISRNGRNISQINNRILAHSLSLAAASGSESYGQLNLYLSYSINNHWLVDIDASTDFSSADNSRAWSVNLGYVF